ncbi:MAG: hypothetical protein HY926_04110 [Elusimicrobia bacterium]|nr:hypothetical protein [Elusimicrobiota bacterium]
MLRSLGLLLLCAALSPRPALAAGCERAFSLVSWNIQTFGDVKPRRQALCASAYSAVISSGVLVVAAQEVAHIRGLRRLLDLLPGRRDWRASFADTPDSQDNAILARGGAAIDAHGFLFADGRTGALDRGRAVHPVRWAHVRVDDFDFTLVSLHLAFQGGNASASRRELAALLDWLEVYFADPASDPDVVIAGDFNLPTGKGKTLSRRARSRDWTPLEEMIREDGRFAEGSHRLAVLVDEPTSRPGKIPQNNYDHFILSPGALARLVSAGRTPREAVDRADRDLRERVSDHYPITATFCSQGGGVKPDAPFAGRRAEFPAVIAAGPPEPTGL